MSRLIFSVAFLLIVVLAQSKPVSSKNAEITAINFFKNQYLKTFDRGIVFKTFSTFSKGKYEEPAYYIFNNSNGGFVIVSGDDYAFPIIGYSFHGSVDYDNMPVQLESLLNSFENQIYEIRNNKKNSGYSELWEQLITGNIINNKGDFKTVDALLTTKWSQGTNYNSYCPPNSIGPDGHCVTGCVATAMGQVMKYHEYPEHGTGTMTYEFGAIYVIDLENTFYRWDEMTTYANSTSGDAISELLFHCGVSVNMNYGPDASSSYTEWIPNAIKTKFGYHPSVRYLVRTDYSDEVWDIMIRDNLDNLYPLVYSGVGASGGHAFVCDGYQDTCFYHFNWGWSGSGNGYYYYNTLSPSGSDFSYYQGAVFDFKPYFSYYCLEGKEMNEPSRSFEDGSGLSYYWPNTNCTWLIAPDSAAKIVVSFVSFDTEAGKDVLSIYNGSDESAPLIGQFSGSTIPASFTSAGNTLFLRFESDASNQSTGWEISYQSQPIGIDDILIDGNWKFYPNPSNNIVSFEIDGTMLLEFFNINGEKVLSKIINNNFTIDVKDFHPGFYFLKLSNNNAIYSGKLLVY